MKCTALTSNLAALTLGALIALVPASAEAGWGLFGGSGGGGSYGSAGSYGSYGSAAGYGSVGASYGYGSTGAAYSASYGSYGSTGGSSGGSSGVEPGPFRRMFSHLHHKVHNHIARRTAYGSVGGSSGGGSSGGGSSGGYAASYGSYGSSYSGGSSGGYGVYSGGSSGGAVSYGSTGAMYAPSVGSRYGTAGSMYYGASNQSASGVGGLVSNSRVSDDSVMLTVAVPTSAKVYVNENPTTSKGAIRQFVSRGLVGGKAYKFVIRAELAGADGKIVSETKSVTVAAGQREAIEFAMAKQQNKPVETAVTLHVPLGAKVILAGKETSVSGSTRTFRTNQLALGQVWEDYTIEVKVGEKSKQQKVRLLAGDEIELTFDFGATTDHIASR